MSSAQPIHQESEEKTDDFSLNRLMRPIYMSHIKAGSTLCSNGSVLLDQDGSTTIELRIPPKLQPKKIPWRYGLVRDITWCPELETFILLTRDALYSFSPKSLLLTENATTNKPIPDLKINTFKKVKPYDENNSFWRCTCAGATLYITYSGFGTVVDQYLLEGATCKLVHRWTPPTTCAAYEGIWCIRYQPETNQLGFAIMDTRDNQWHMEIRHRENFSPIWRTVLPFMHGDCEISSLPNEEWLAINSCGVRLVQIANHKIKSAVEYERDLKNAISIGNLYFIVRTKGTIEVYPYKQSK